MDKPIIVIKIGGNQLYQPGFIENLAGAIAAKQVENACIVVHGGGRKVTEMMARLNVQPKFVDGQRATDEEALEITEMVLSGKINKDLVVALIGHGLEAVGLSGIDHKLLQVEPWGEGMGQVGRVVKVRESIFYGYCAENIIPVISPISIGPAGKYNVNADHAAGMIAGAVNAQELLFISNVPGVMVNEKIEPCLSEEQVNDLICSASINGGMIPKVRAALSASQQGVQRACITDLEGFMKKEGTTITMRSVGGR